VAGTGEYVVTKTLCGFGEAASGDWGPEGRTEVSLDGGQGRSGLQCHARIEEGSQRDSDCNPGKRAVTGLMQESVGTIGMLSAGLILVVMAANVAAAVAIGLVGNVVVAAMAVKLACGQRVLRPVKLVQLRH
jgi:hypothetical protein